MKSRRWVALAAFALAAAVQAQAQQASVRLRAHADAAGVRATLGQLADIEGADAALVRRLASTEVALAPRVGQVQSLRRDAIARRVELAHPALRGKLAWQGADAVELRTAGEPIDAQTLRALAERTLVEALAARGLRAEVQPSGEPTELRLPAGTRRLSARLAEQGALSRRMCVWVDVELDGRGYRSVPVWFAVKAYREVLVAAEPLRAGDALHAGQLRTESFDVATLTSAPLPVKGGSPNGLRLRRPVAAGQPLTAAAVEARPAVLRDAPVQVQVTLGAVSLQTAGIALADARLGETVKARNPASNESFGAIVVAESAVRVEGR